MAKKTKPKAAPKSKHRFKAKPAKQTKGAAERVLRRGPIRRPPADRALPGMEDLGKSKKLDAHCRRIAEIRSSMADLRADEASELQATLDTMRREKFTAYQRHGVELARVPGEEKLRVRTARETTATATVEDDPEAGTVEAMDAEPGDEGMLEDGAEWGGDEANV